MLNYFIIILLWAAVILGAVSAVAEMLFRRNTAPHRFFRAIWIRLREFDTLSFGVTSVILLFWGTAVSDDNFYGIWMAIAMMLAVLTAVHAEDLFTFKKRRKKARKKTDFSHTSNQILLLSKDAPLSREAVLLTPMDDLSGKQAE